MNEELQKRIRKFPTSELPVRYGVDLSVVATRLYALYIEPQRSGNKFYITTKELRLMDDLHAQLKVEEKVDKSAQYHQSTRFIYHRNAARLSPHQSSRAILVRQLFNEWLTTLQAEKWENYAE